MDFKRVVCRALLFDGSAEARDFLVNEFGAEFGPDGTLVYRGAEIRRGDFFVVEIDRGGLFEEMEHELTTLNGLYATDKEEAIPKSKRDMFWSVTLERLLERLRE